MADADNERVLIDVTIAAPRSDVWQALRDPTIIAQWFGWDYESLPEEIEFIFGKGPTSADEASGMLQFGAWEGSSDRFELTDVADGKTRLRVVRASPAWADGWEKIYEETIEGWIGFVEQLRFLLERHPGGARRTLRLSGKADERHRLPTDALGIDGLRDAKNGSHYVADLPTGERISGHVWHTARHQVGLAVEQWNDALLIVVDQPKSESAPRGGGAVTLTTFGMPEAEFAALEERWTAWWTERYPA
jgi:hypothetical protein